MVNHCLVWLTIELELLTIELEWLTIELEWLTIVLYLYFNRPVPFSSLDVELRHDLLCKLVTLLKRNFLY